LRAVFYNINESNKAGDRIIISGESAHHLNVVRVKHNEEILILNGCGQKFLSKILEINKKEVLLEILNCEKVQSYHQISLALATPKKDAFEDIIKSAVELGVTEIYPLSSQYSQFEFIKNDRTDRLIESAMVQSNNPYFPTIHGQNTLDNFLKNVNNDLIYFSAKPTAAPLEIIKTRKYTILIGPEAGFSESEEEQIFANPVTTTIHLPVPILRAPTAAIASLGHLLAYLR
jgi:16S rRNA (uracil1498-N3)-methyltransferase